MIEGDHTLLELEPLVEAVRQGQLMSYRHNGFWHCMDSKRDHETLEAMWNNGNPPWIVK